MAEFAKVIEEPLFAPIEEEQFFAKVGKTAEEISLGITQGAREGLGGGIFGAARIAGEVFDSPILKESFRSFQDSAKFLTPEDPGLTTAVSKNIGNVLTNLLFFKDKAVPAISVESGLRATAEALEEGHSLARASIYGGLVGASEYITEKFGLIPDLLKKAPGTKKILLSIAEDTGLEIVNFLVQEGLIDPAVLREDFPTMEELWAGVKETGVVNTISSVILGGGKLTADKLNLPKKADIPPKTPAIDAKLREAKLIPVSREAEELLERVKPKPTINFEAEVLAEVIKPPTEGRRLVGLTKPVPDIVRDLQKQHAHVQSLFNEENPDLYVDDVDNQIVTSLDAQMALMEPVVIAEKELRTIPFEEDTIPDQAVRIDAMESYPEVLAQEEKLIKRDDPIRLKSEIEQIPERPIEPSLEAWEDDVVTKTMDEASIRAKKKLSFNKVRNATNRLLIDRSGNIKRELLKTKDPRAIQAKMRLENRAGASAWSEHEMQLAVDQTTRGLDKNEERMFNAVIQGMRSIEISNDKPDFKFQKNLTAQNYATNIKKIPQDKLKKIKQRAEKYWAVLDSGLQDLVDAGITTPQQKERLRAKGDFYAPRRVLDYVDGPETIRNIGGKKISVPDSGIAKLSDEGSLKMIESDATLLLHEAITRKNARIFSNRANQALYQFALDNPDNGLVKIAQIVGETKEGKLKFQKTPKDMEKFSVMVEGQERQFFMEKDMAEEWVVNDPQINQQLGTALNIISGSFILRPFATGLNPVFALGNFPRDTAHAMFVTNEFSPFLPLATYQMSQDLKETWKDAKEKKGLYVDYLKHGGGIFGLTHQGRVTKGLKGALRWFQNVAGWMGETSEIWVRLAVMNRVIKNKTNKGKLPVTPEILEESANVARNTLDFFQGGNLVKLLDKGIPYLNAGTQGTRTVLRASKENPAIFTLKAAQIGALAAGIWGLWEYGFKEFQKDIPKKDQVNSWNIPLGIIFKDKKGRRRLVYFKIAKDQGQRMFATFFENIMRAAHGQPFDWDLQKQAVKDFLPATPSDLMPPTLDAWMGMKSNVNFWTDERIWKGAEVEPEEEFDRFTPEAFKAIGQTVGESPKRLQYAFNQIFTYGNVWTSMAMWPINKMLEEVGEEDADKIGNDMWVELSRTPIIKRFIGVTDPDSRIANERREALVKENTRKLRMKRVYDELKAAVLRGEELPDKMRAFVESLEEDDLRIIVNREKKHNKLESAGLNEPSYWLRLEGLPPRAKAAIIFQEVMTTSEERKLLLIEDFNKLSQSKLLGLSSPTVKRELDKMIKKTRRGG